MDQTLVDLKMLQALFSDPARWTAGAEARSANGTKVPYYDPKACKWCLLGGIDVLTLDPERRRRVKENLLPNIFGFYFYADTLLRQANDDYGYDNVMKLINEAVSRVGTLTI